MTDDSGHVAAIPRGPAIIRSAAAPLSASPGDKINVSCSVLGSRPAPTLTWSVARPDRLELDLSLLMLALLH